MAVMRSLAVGRRGVALVLGGVVLAAGVGAYVWWSGGDQAGPGVVLSAPGAESAKGPRSLAEVRKVLANGAFKGIKPYGDWCLTQAGVPLKPCAALRDRFEYYINGLGDASLAELRDLIEDDVRQAFGGDRASEVITVYDRYWAVRTYPYQNAINIGDAAAWEGALQERHEVRWQTLGADWAEAFFADEERQNRSDIADVRQGRSPKAAALNAAPQKLSTGQTWQAQHADLTRKYGEAGAERIEQQQMAQAKFERAVNQTRSEWMRITMTKGLSDVEQRAQLNRYVEQYVDPVDRDRVLTLARMRPR